MKKRNLEYKAQLTLIRGRRPKKTVLVTWALLWHWLSLLISSVASEMKREWKRNFFKKTFPRSGNHACIVRTEKLMFEATRSKGMCGLVSTRRLEGFVTCWAIFLNKLSELRKPGRTTAASKRGEARKRNGTFDMIWYDVIWYIINDVKWDFSLAASACRPWAHA